MVRPGEKLSLFPVTGQYSPRRSDSFFILFYRIMIYFRIFESVRLFPAGADCSSRIHHPSDPISTCVRIYLQSSENTSVLRAFPPYPVCCVSGVIWPLKAYSRHSSPLFSMVYCVLYVGIGYFGWCMACKTAWEKEKAFALVLVCV